MSAFDQLPGTAAGADLLGIDLARTASGDAAEGLGQLNLSQGEQVALDDIAERLRTEKGSLFYDVDFGSPVGQWLEAPDTAEHRARLETEAELTVEADPRVGPGTAVARVASWTDAPRAIRLTISWAWIRSDHPANLVVELDEAGVRTVATAYNDGGNQT